MYVKASVTVLSVEEQGCSRSTLIHRLRMFEPQVMENRNAMPAMEQESAASATAQDGYSFHGCQKGRHRKQNSL